MKTKDSTILATVSTEEVRESVFNSISKVNSSNFIDGFEVISKLKNQIYHENIDINSDLLIISYTKNDKKWVYIKHSFLESPSVYKLCQITNKYFEVLPEPEEDYHGHEDYDEIIINSVDDLAVLLNAGYKILCFKDVRNYKRELAFYMIEYKHMFGMEQTSNDVIWNSFVKQEPPNDPYVDGVFDEINKLEDKNKEKL